jgi:hypothetical protein
VRSRLALAAVLAISSISGAVEATPPEPSARRDILLGGGLPVREAVQLRVAQLPGDDLGVTVDLRYAATDEAPAVDRLAVGPVEPRAVTASTGGGRVLLPRILRDLDGNYHLEIPPRAPPDDRSVHLRFEQSPPPPQRFGWRYGLAELRWPERADGGLGTVVIVPAGMSLPGHACAPEGAASACARTTSGPRRLPLILRAPADLPGLVLLALALAAAFAGFALAFRRSAAALVEAIRAEPVPASEAPGGAYRAPPPRVVGARVDAGGVLRALTWRAVVVAVPAALSVGAVAVLGSGLSPWPMPSLTAAWVAVVGVVSARALARR